jgi:ATP phosphoribosyltransferase regulatory subunit
MARLTLDPSERHGFEYQSWFGFTLYADGLSGALGRGGTYSILGAGAGESEPAIGFSLYPDPLINSLAAAEPAREAVFLPLDHDAAAAEALRASGKRTVAALCENCDPVKLGCTHRLQGEEVVPL